MTGWETFSGVRLHGAFGVPTISISAARVFYLNAAAAQLLGGAPRVELLWDAERRRIGLRPAGATTPRSYALTPYPHRRASQIAAGVFLRHYGLRDLTGKRLPAHLEGDVLVVPLAPATDAGTAVES